MAYILRDQALGSHHPQPTISSMVRWEKFKSPNILGAGSVTHLT
jgi:hypothetical protein